VIERIRGTLLAVDDDGITVGVGGFALRVQVPGAVLAHMGALLEGTGGSPAVSLATHLLIRPESWQLFGFAGEDEREFFRVLLGVSGIGPRHALSILSHLALADVRAAVAQRDPSVFESVPGIGKRIAERIVLELSGRLKLEATPAGPAGAPDAVRDALEALAALGLGRPEASALVRAALQAGPETGSSTAALVAEALRLRQARG
jgi:Holliday junction DNA helicase RuvA